MLTEMFASCDQACEVADTLQQFTVSRRGRVLNVRPKLFPQDCLQRQPDGAIFYSLIAANTLCSIATFIVFDGYLDQQCEAFVSFCLYLLGALRGPVTGLHSFALTTSATINTLQCSHCRMCS